VVPFTLYLVTMPPTIELDGEQRIVVFIADHKIEVRLERETVKLAAKAAILDREHISKPRFYINPVSVVANDGLELVVNGFLARVQDFLKRVGSAHGMG
jgi:hypothetical protein